MKIPANPGKKTAVRLSDVAKMVGVSAATVSRALALPGAVRDSTRKAILEAVRATGYIPNVAARNLRVRKTNMILVIVSQIGNTFLADILGSIDEELTRNGYGLIIGHLDNHPGRENQFLRVAISGAVDGIMLLSLNRIPQNDHQTMLDCGLPMVSINERFEGADFPQVSVCNFEASVEVVHHLYKLGHRNIGFIRGPEGIYTADARLAGFRAGLAQYGLDPDAASVWMGNYQFADGAAAAEACLRQAQRPTAVYATNDEMAIGFIKHMHEQGVKVPEDISVVGFDGVAFGDYSIPTLTTVQQPKQDLGRIAAQTLVRQLHGETVIMDERLVAPLIIRKSTGPAKTSA